jgi:hypothetical protein
MDGDKIKTNPNKVGFGGGSDKTLKSRLIGPTQFSKFLKDHLILDRPLLITRVGGIEGQIFYKAVLSEDKIL